MPIYEYICNDCGKTFEVIQKFSDKPVKKCSHCSGNRVEKVISQSSFVLKGTGWYATDYAKKGTDSKESPAKPDCSGCCSSK